MNVIQQTYKYMQKYLYNNEYEDFLTENHMLYIMKNYLPDICMNNFKKDILYNRIQTSLVINEMIRINKLLKESCIDAIFFKGVILAQQLYEPIYIRNAGDIDLYVGEKSIEAAYEILVHNGYSLLDGTSICNPHHIQLVRHGMLIELHRRIITSSRNIKINETYMLSHTKSIFLDRVEFKTFDETATLLHLIYHLYMHTVIDYKEITNKNQYFVQRYNLFVKRRFYRIFEIALYAEKYTNKIKWDELLDDISSTCLYDAMAEIFSDINIIYPGVFPDYSIKKIISTAIDLSIPYNAFNEYYHVKTDSKEVDAFSVLRDVIEKTWDSEIVFQCQFAEPVDYYEVDEFQLKKYNKRKTYIFQGTPPRSPEDISFKFKFWVDNDELNLNICIKDDIIIMDENHQHDYLQCDCLCVTIVTVGKVYRQSPIYVFLRKDGEKVIAVPYDIVHGGKPLAEILSTVATIKHDGYHIGISVPLKYIQYNPDRDDHFYMDVMVYDCDDVHDGVKTVLSATSVLSDLYNPKEYIKIICSPRI